mgnify:FL=1
MFCRTFLALVILLVQSTPAHSEEIETMIEVRARCLYGDPCRFMGEVIDVELELKNRGEEGVDLPLRYFREQGPKMIFVDNHSGKEKRFRMGPPMRELFNKLETLPPGKSIRVPWRIQADDISMFALRPVDLTVRFNFYLAPVAGQADEVFATAELRILDGR